MSEFAAWGMTLLGLAVISGIAEMFLPHGKTKNVIRSVFAVVAITAVITPLPSLFKGEFSFNFDYSGTVSDSEYLDYVDKLKTDMLAQAAYDYLEANGYPDCKALVKIQPITADSYSVVSAKVNFVDSSITENNAHINRKEIIKLIANFYDIGEEAIMTYG